MIYNNNAIKRQNIIILIAKMQEKNIFYNKQNG